MSDSEDEATFASADEGEDQTNKSAESQQKTQSTQLQEDKCEPAIDNEKATQPQKSEKPHSGSENTTSKKTQAQEKGKGGKHAKKKGGKGKPVQKQTEKEEKVEKVSTSGATADVKENTETKTDKPSKPQEQEESKQEEKVLESAESRLNKHSEVSDNKDNKTENVPTKQDSSSVDDKASGDTGGDQKGKSSEEQSIPGKDDKKKEDPRSALDKLADDDESGDNWSWGNWSSSLMDAASTSVSTFTHQVGEGFTTILDTVETSLGAPTPEELVMAQGIKEPVEETIKTAPEESSIDRAEDVKEEKSEEQSKETQDSNTNPEGESKESSSSGGASGGWWSGWGVSSLTSVVQSTTNIVQSKGKHLVSGGLDVLETIGKKTMDVIKDHDPGLKKTRELFLFDKGDKQSLSSLLREAKDEAAEKAEQEKEFEESRKAHFGCMFDEYQGIAHLEALEILSNQCEKKVQTLLSSMPTESLMEIKTELIQVKQVFEREEDEDEEEETEHDFSKLVTEYLSEFHLGTTPNKINTTQEKIRKGIAEFYEEKGEEDAKTDPKIVHQTAIQSLAELTSKSVEQFHKAGELILLHKDSDKKFLDRSKSLSSFTKVLCTEVGILSTKFSHCLNKLAEDMEDTSVVNPLVTNIYLEATNSSTYIQDAFQLLLPCLQQAIIESQARV